jgi:hypothetical protein
MSFEGMASGTKGTENKPGEYNQDDFEKETQKIDSHELKQMSPDNASKKDDSQSVEKRKVEQKREALSEKEQNLEKIKKLGEQSGLDVSSTLSNIESEIKTMKQEIPVEDGAKTSKQAESNETNQADKSQETSENKEKERNPAQLVLEKINKHELVDCTKRLAYILREREDERYTPIVHPDAAQHLSATAGGLEDLLQNRKATMEDITMILRRIGGVMNAIGKDLPRSSILRDDSESLKKVVYVVRNVAESCNNIKLELGGQGDENMEEVISYFDRLVDVAGEAFSYLVKKHHILSNR